MNIFNNKCINIIDIILICITILLIVFSPSIREYYENTPYINGVLYSYEGFNSNGNGNNGSGTNSNGSGTNSNGSGTNSNGSGTNSNGSGTNSNGSGTNSNGSGTNSNGSGTNSNGSGTNSNGSGTNSNGNGNNGSDTNNNGSDVNNKKTNLTLGYIDFNTLFNLGNQMNQEQINDNVNEVIITRDPNITKYSDTYSMTPYATYILGPLSNLDGNDINFVEGRYDNCIGKWIDLDKEEKCIRNADSSDPHEFPDRHTSNIWENPCDLYSRQYIIYNPEFVGEPCRDKNNNVLENGQIEYATCNIDDDIRCGSNDESSGHCDSSDSSVCRCYNGYSGDNCENTNQIL
jgi:hypothetical protein